MHASNQRVRAVKRIDGYTVKVEVDKIDYGTIEKVLVVC